MLKPLFWLGRRLAFVALAFLGAGAALLIYSSVGQAGLVDGDNMGGYTYTGDTCAEGGSSDPINIVFYQGATSPDIDYYLGLEDGWGNHGGETQYFKTYGNCYEMDGMKASGTLQVSRYHGRYHRGLDAGGNIDIETPWLDYSIANAHYEVVVFGGGDCDPVDHVVQGGEPSGFDLGRDNVVGDWTEEGEPDHFFAGYGYWDNIEHIRQCTNEYAWSDGNVAFIRVATGDVEGMSLSPDPADLWVCYNSPSHTCDPYSEGNRFVFEDFRNETGIGLGDYSFTVGFPSSLLSVNSITTGGEWFLEALGRDAACENSSGTGWLHHWCWSWGDERGPPDNGDIATLLVQPNPQTFYHGNFDHRPTKDNGITLSLDNRYCSARGVDGVPLPGSNGDYTPVCDDASVKLRILEGDVNLDCKVDAFDDQAIAFRWASFFGLPLYDEWYDFCTWGAGCSEMPDFYIGIGDLQYVFGRNYSTCQAPRPCDQSGLTCP